MNIKTRFSTLITLAALAAALLAGRGTARAAGVEPPDTPAGRQFAAWLAAFNSGDRETLRQFTAKNRPQALPRLDGMMEFRERTGGFDLLKVEQSTPTHLRGIVKERKSDMYGRVEFEVDAAEPHLVTGLSIEMIPAPPDLKAAAPPPVLTPRMTQSDALAAFRAEIDKRVAEDRFAGAALIAKDGKPVFDQAYGLANREQKTPNTLDTKFRLGSMNKMFTAVSILQLAQAGKIDLNAPVGRYLTDYPNKDLARATIHQLLTHTGGAGDVFGPEFDAHRQDLRTPADFVKLYGERGPRYEPGAKWEYSNYGFVLLGAVIERVSGQSYYDYVDQHVFKPAGMTSTGSRPENENVPQRSTGYMKAEGSSTLIPNTDGLPYRGMPAGGGYSTVGDLLRFAAALQNHKLLNAEYTDLLTTGKVDTPFGTRYAYGFRDSIINGVRCFGHSGGAPGMNGDLQICPASGYVVAILANLDPFAAEDLTRFILPRLPEK